MTKQFNLSKKVKETCKGKLDYRFIYLEKDIKEFITKLKEKINDTEKIMHGQTEWDDGFDCAIRYVNKTIDKLTVKRLK